VIGFDSSAVGLKSMEAGDMVLFIQPIVSSPC
jgi:hypothetical protein